MKGFPIMDREAVGEALSLQSMLRARARTFEAVGRIAAAVHPGACEAEACARAEAILGEMGMERLWHKTLVRFGEGTLKTFHERADPGRVLADDDIFFVDLGVVWEGHEGDAGDTFVVGDDPEMRACAKAARSLWGQVEERWRADRLSGGELYRFAAQAAEAAGWRLNQEIRGHRVCDFPHAIYRAGSLGDFSDCPAAGLWILEIQIAYPTRPFGAFFEDLLFEEPAPLQGESQIS